MITVRLEGDRQVAFELNSMSKALANVAMPEIVKSAAYVIENKIKENLSGKILKVRSNRLRNSITTRLYGSKGNAGAEVGSNVKYASVHEFGAKITARNFPYLHFPIKRGSVILSWVKVKQVTIPARKPFEKSFKESLKPVDVIIDRIMDKHIK